MLRSREVKEFFSSSVFYIVTAIFISLSGYKFYSLLLAFIDTISVYPEYIVGSQVGSMMGSDAGSYIFPQLFMFYAYLCVMAVSVLSSGLGHDRFMDMDKIELLSTGVNPLSLVVRKSLSTVISVMFMLAPTIVYPAVISLFTYIDWGIILSSYLGLFLLIFIYSGLASVPGVFKLPQSVGIFLNLVALLFIHFYYFDAVFAPFFYGVLRVSTILFSIVIFFASSLMSRSLYKAVRIYS